MTDLTERLENKASTAAAPDSEATLGELMSAFEEFKRTNDGRLKELEKRGAADALTEDKLGRLNQALDGAKAAMDRLALERARPALEAGRPEQGDEYKDAFSAYVKRGEEKALSIGSNADGGYLVPTETETEILRRLAAVSPIRAIASVRNVSSSVYRKPVTLTGPAVGWVAETAARPQTTSQTIDAIDFATAELYAMPAATSAFLDDAAVDVGQWIADEVNTAFAEQETAAFVSGNGTNKPKGFLAEAQVAEASWAWDKIGYLATGVSGDWPAGDESDVLVDLVYALKAGYRQNASWVMNRKTQGSVRKLKDAEGNYLWSPGAAAGAKATLMGFELVEAEDMPDIGAGTTPIAFGDFRRGYLVVDRMGVNVLRDPYSAKPYVLFYTTKRVGGGVQDFDAIKLLKFSAS
ncbi:MAG: phage major capsid protein [Devosia sp.]|uniref:phage major capsid protein n=1 Tax=Devosia sp. TaxID=1871048 RepID=UPI001AC3EE40|nr:phage major capsid protein [Devosia sp.]MBN9317318.1 phage major capsid protein [Devosia sp.]